MSHTILVLGASGNVGQPLVNTLLKQGHKVKAASRSGQAPLGAEGVVFDYLDQASVEQAFTGVDSVYALVPAGYLDVKGLLKLTFEQASKQHCKLVLQTVIGVDADEEIPYRQLERRLEQAGIPYVILRPNWFTDNFHTFWLAGIKQGSIALPAGEGKSSFICADDIAAVAAVVLTTQQFDNQAFNLTGPEALSYAQVATLLSQEFEQTISYHAIDDKQFIANLCQAGVPLDYANFMAAIFYPVREGWTALISDAVERITGVKPRSVKQYAASHRGYFNSLAV